MGSAAADGHGSGGEIGETGDPGGRRAARGRPRGGHTCLGPAGSLAEVLQLAEANRVDAAILDVRLRHGEKVYPVADLLAGRGIPFAFVTAYGSAHVDPRYAHCRILPKPVLREELELLIQELTRSPESAPPTPCHGLPAAAR